MPASYKDILVCAYDNEASDARLERVLELAEFFGAHVSGVHINPGLQRSTIDALPFAGALKDELKSGVDDRERRARDRFERVVGAQRLSAASTEWRQTEISGPSTLALNARYSDLLVLGRDADPSIDPGIGAGIDCVSMSAGVPVLFIPESAVSLLPGKRVVVGWNRGKESIRALHDALPFLQRAEAVDVVSVSPPLEDASVHLSGADICRHLARLGVSASARTISSAGQDTSVTLLSAAADLGADLIVMGAYGHARVREMVLGGTTAQVMRDMTLPVLMSH